MYASDTDSLGSITSNISKLNTINWANSGRIASSQASRASNRVRTLEPPNKILKLNADHKFFKEYAAMNDAFSRLDANPEAIKDNIKNLLEKPFMVAVRGMSKASNRVVSRANSR